MIFSMQSLSHELGHFFYSNFQTNIKSTHVMCYAIPRIINIYH